MDEKLLFQKPTYGSLKLANSTTVWPESQTPHSDNLDLSEDLKIQIWGYRINDVKRNVCRIFYVLTLGFLKLIFYWKPLWHARSTCDPCPLSVADNVYIQDDHHTEFFRPIKSLKNVDGFTLILPSGNSAYVNVLRYFVLRKVKFVWYNSTNSFHRIYDFNENVPSKILHSSSPLNDDEVQRRFSIYGPNEITVNLVPIHILLFKEVLNPFYLFQIFSVSLWFYEEYYIYAAIIVCMSIVSLSINVYQTRKNQRTLRDVMYSTDIVTVVRKDQNGRDRNMQINSTKLVVGDLFIVPSRGCTMECDAVLLYGDCVVNESMLTGESVPITKTSLPATPTDLRYDSKSQSKSTLFCGTKVLLTRGGADNSVKALVVRTGYNTAKGRLVCSILYPKPVDFAFTKDILLFLAVLGAFAGVGFLYTIILMLLRANGAEKIIIKALDIITTVVPPFLPAAMTIGIIASESRLKKEHIFCTSPSSINTCGAVDCACFDKTGTLTEDGLDLMGVLPADKIRYDAALLPMASVDSDSHLVMAMASCHSLVRIDGELAGDPMDLILFNESGWSFEEAAGISDSDSPSTTCVKSLDARTVLRCMKQFIFTSQLRRMSVLVKNDADASLWIYCKGAPETVTELCRPDTVPDDFPKVLNEYAKRGYRILGFACKHLDSRKPIDNIRDDAESQLTFLGLVVFENKLKPQTVGIIEQLKNANIRTVMITGDNVMTAISVAKECRIFDRIRPIFALNAYAIGEEVKISVTLQERGGDKGYHQNGQAPEFDFEKGLNVETAHYQLAIEGSSLLILTKFYPNSLSKLASVCDVFARMSPEQKVQVVSGLQEIGHVVAMCGDGANDCGALKAAHVGISLSEAEASIASPFTSKFANISCVSTLIREGRAALVTSFGIFKYMIGYSMTEFVSVVMLYYIGSNLSDYQYLYIDLFLTMTFMTFFGYTGPSGQLSERRPPNRLLSISSFASIFMQIFLVFCVQIFVYTVVGAQPWFVPMVYPGDEYNYYSYQGTAVFCVSIFQYITVMVVYCKSHPYRRTIFSNVYLLINLFVCVAISVWWVVKPPNAVATLLNFKMAPVISFRIFLLFVAAFHFLIALFLETFFIDYLLLEILEPRGYCQRWRKAEPKRVGLIVNIGQDPNMLIERNSDNKY